MTQTYIARDGDTVDAIAWRVYGTTDSLVVERLLEANPGVANTAQLVAGTKVLLPTLDTKTERTAVRLWD